MPEHVPLLRVFLSSPNDVNDERKAVLEILDRLPSRPAYRERVQFRVIAWDKPGADTPMLATMSPQEAIDAGLPRPSDCDIVITIFWKRMGTPFAYHGKDYLSGTHYELLDALNSTRPQTLIYHRSTTPDLNPDDDEAHLQYRTLKKFLKSDLFYDERGRILRGINSFNSPADFREKFEGHLEEVVERILRKIATDPTPATPVELTPPSSAGTVIDIRSRLWEGSPFPGLRSFTKDDAPIFFGRERETDALVKRVAESRFVAVVGASGSGKSSLVGAGLLPRLEANAISSETTGSKDWRIVQFTPGQSDHPFAALFDGIVKTFEALRPSPFEIRRVKNQFVQDLTADPLTACDTLSAALDAEKAPTWAEVCLFIDQFEELFTLAKADSIAPFARMLSKLAQQPRIRIVTTIRHDFVHRAIEIPELAELLNLGSLHLAAPTPGSLAQMIKRPAELAALEFEDGLPEQILSDMGGQAGALALMAYTLDELYKIAEARHDRRLTFADYAALEGVQGAIGKRAEQTFTQLAIDDKEALLAQVFRELVEVDERGTATRQRCPIGRFNDAALVLVRAFTDARLLVMDEDAVEVAHEALFRSWERLKTWIAEAQEDLILLRQTRAAAHDWQTKREREPGKDFDYLRWPAERLTLVYAMQARLKPELNEVEQDFIEPEQTRLLREIDNIATDHKRRRWIGERLATIGDPRSGIGIDANGIPQIDWLRVEPGGQIEIEGQNFTIQPFYVAKYLVTYAQFQAFLDAPDGFANENWWKGFPSQYVRQEMSTATAQYDNYPRDSVSWYQSVAFARWLDAKYREYGLFEALPALTPSPSPWGEGLKDYREMAAKVMVNIARDLRQRQTSAEMLLWECLRDRRLNDLKFRRQHPVPNTSFVVDFFCNEAQLVIEVDGPIHEGQQHEDAVRQQALENAGLRVIRFTNEEVFNNLERVLIDIQRAAVAPLSLGRGAGGEGWQIRLPTEWEWQWMAQNGTEARQYPWGDWDEHPRANTTEAGIGDRSTAVGMYPHGAADCGALDVAGNLSEWCLNDYQNPEIFNGYGNDKAKVLRGGSFDRDQFVAACAFRSVSIPLSGDFSFGLRLAVCPISAL